MRHNIQMEPPLVRSRVPVTRLIWRVGPTIGRNIMRVGREREEVRSVMARDGDRCVACGLNLKCVLATHHRLPRELGGRDTLSNLITLCANCHRAVHWFAHAQPK